MNLIQRDMASAKGLTQDQAQIVADLIGSWSKHVVKNRKRENYYLGKVSVKDLGVSVSKDIAKKLDPHIDWAAKSVNWWADRVQFQGFTCQDEEVLNELDRISRLNDLGNLVRKAVLCALKTSPSFIAVTCGDTDHGEPEVVLSGYPATAASAIWSDAKKRIQAGLVVVDTKYMASYRRKVPTLAYVLTDTECIILRASGGGWVASSEPHSMGRVPMEPVTYHPTLERPFGSSRITSTVMGLVDDAQRELMNMAATAAFAAAPQKYFMGADPAAIKAIEGSPFGAFVGSIMAASPNKKGNTPTYGQLPQLTMQPHSDYMHLLASMFSDATSVPLSSLGFSGVNPTSADAIIASKEDAIVDINGFISSVRQSLVIVASMAIAAARNQSYTDIISSYEIGAIFVDPATPSPVSMSSAIKERVETFPWMADSDVPLRDLGYSGDELSELVRDRSRANANNMIEALGQMGQV